MSSTYKELDEAISQRLIAAAGGGLVVVGTVLPWTQYDMSLGETLEGTTAGVAASSGIAVLLAGLAVVAVALFVNRDAFTAAVAGIAAGVALSTAVPVWVEPTSFTPGVDWVSTRGESYYESAYGLWLTILGGVVVGYEALALGWATSGDEDPRPRYESN